MRVSECVQPFSFKHFAKLIFESEFSKTVPSHVTCPNAWTGVKVGRAESDLELENNIVEVEIEVELEDETR